MKTLADFDFSLQSSVKREQIESLHTLGFLEGKENVVLLGPPGVGKTSNKGLEDWGEIFGDEIMAVALIDRLVRHCHIVNIRGNSYRLRQHSEFQLRLRQRPASPPERSLKRKEGAATASG